MLRICPGYELSVARIPVICFSTTVLFGARSQISNGAVLPPLHSKLNIHCKQFPPEGEQKSNEPSIQALSSWLDVLEVISFTLVLDTTLLGLFKINKNVCCLSGS